MKPLTKPLEERLAGLIKKHRTEYSDLSTQEAIQSYRDQMIIEFNEILPYLPKEINSIMDIGCGVAGIDILLMQRYPNASLILLDEDGNREEVGGFHQTYTPYTSREVVNKLLEMNGITRYKWKPIGSKGLLKADLVISLLSWGYHYPLSTYKVKSKMTICDVRDGYEPDNYRVIKHQDNFTRIVL
jgi:hypothetical protein